MYKFNPFSGKLDYFQAASSGAPSDATYITQTPNGSLSNEQALSLLASGYMKSATTTGIITTQAVPIPVADGGIGASTLTNHAVLLGQGTSAPAGVVLTDGQIVVGATGADPTAATMSGDATLSALGALTLANVVSASTNTKITFNAKGLVTGAAAATLASADFINQGTTTTVLHGNAAGNPSWSAVSLTADVSGILPIANGGTNNNTAYAAGSVLFADGTKIAEDNANFFWDNANDRLGLGTASPSYRLHLLSTIAASGLGASMQITGSGSAAGLLAGAKISLLAGYTGSSGSFGVYAQNQSAGTSTDEFNNAQAANYGEYIATTAGHIIGQAGYASGGNRSYGGLFRAIVSKNSATNIGVAGYALNAGTSPIQIGGYFALLNASPTLTSAALLCDNGNQTDPIFLGKDNGTTVFTILDGGNVGIGETAPADRLALKTSTGICGLSTNFVQTFQEGYFVIKENGSNVGVFEAFGSTWASAPARNLVSFTASVNNLGALGFVTQKAGSYVTNLYIANNGNASFGLGLVAGTARIHIAAGTATAGTAPIKLTSGTVNTTPEAGAIEWDGVDLFISI